MNDDMRGLSQGTIITLKIFFIVLSFVAVTLRLFANWKYSRKLLIDDYISISAVPFLIAVSVLTDYAGNGFHDPNISTYLVAQLATAISVAVPLALWTCKAPILFLYLRLFGVKKWLRIISYTTLVLMALVNFSGLVAIPVACTPHTADLSEKFIDNCQARTRIVNVYLGGFSVLTDIVILILPLPVVFRLKLLVQSKIGLVFLFLSGLFAITASILALYFKAVSLQLPMVSFALALLATVTECAVALVVGCVPAIRVMWSKILKPTIKTSRENYSLEPSSNRTNRGNSQYIVVGDGADGKASTSHSALIVSTEVHTTTTPYQAPGQPTNLQDVYQGQPYYGQIQQPNSQFGDVHPPFGVYSEAYALQTRHQGVWGR
ncbi:hypothetical protein F5Y19DRAFT_72942 [Xylariaceae sp. FL1651]|nr:hypothetical protein F5Y19DRAFT_72942 [Xylariaceae sp. FL1651]